METGPIQDMDKAFDVVDYNVVVTGGDTGIGRGIAEAFAQRGANVVICSRNKERGEKAASELGQYGGRYLWIECDVADIDSVKRAALDIISFFRHVDVLVNNAGVSTATPFLSEKGLEEWHRVIDVDLHGVANMTHEVAPKMVEYGRGGCIINISSTAAVRVAFDENMQFAPYNVAKAGVDMFTRHMSLVLKRDHIRVVSIQPAMIHSGLDANQPEAALKAATEKIPVGRFGEPLELGAFCVFLASPAASYINGVNYPFDGGLMNVE